MQKLYLLCKKRYKNDSAICPRIVYPGCIYTAVNECGPIDLFYFGESHLWQEDLFQEISKVEAFVKVRGKMNKIKELP